MQTYEATMLSFETDLELVKELLSINAESSSTEEEAVVTP